MGAYYYSAVDVFAEMVCCESVEIHSFMKKKYFPKYIGGLNALVLFELNVTERKQNKTGAGLS